MADGSSGSHSPLSGAKRFRRSSSPLMYSRTRRRRTAQRRMFAIGLLALVAIVLVAFSMSTGSTDESPTGDSPAEPPPEGAAIGQAETPETSEGEAPAPPDDAPESVKDIYLTAESASNRRTAPPRSRPKYKPHTTQARLAGCCGTRRTNTPRKPSAEKAAPRPAGNTPTATPNKLASDLLPNRPLFHTESGRRSHLWWVREARRSAFRDASRVALVFPTREAINRIPYHWYVTMAGAGSRARTCSGSKTGVSC